MSIGEQKNVVTKQKTKYEKYLFMHPKSRQTYNSRYTIYLRKFKFKPLSRPARFPCIYTGENVIVPYNMYIVYWRPLHLPPCMCGK